MTNAAYQAVIRELEQLLPPRVVSRTLKDGLAAVGRTSEDVTLKDLEELLRGPVLRQLQALLPAGRAEEAVAGILDRILDPDSPALHQTPAFEQKVRGELAELRENLKPFNLYFEWPEVQKLRAQLQLLEDEADAGGEVASVLSEARDQLALLRQKLEDQLVLQAGELAELEEALERLSTLGGPRVRRLESLISRIRKAQEQRVLMPAEIDQARLLSVDLRKLLESSVYSTAAPGEELDLKATAELLPEEVNERLRQLDLENEAHRLDQVELQHANLLALRQELSARLASLRSTITGGESAADGITALEVALEQAFAEERLALTRELGSIAADEAALQTPVGMGQLRQALQVANGILATTLPDPADIRHIRSLHELAREQLDVMKHTMHDGTEMADARKLAALQLDDRQSRLNELFQLEQELRRLPSGVSAELDVLREDVSRAKSQLGAEELGQELDGFWNQLEDIRAGLAQRLEDMPARLRTALATFAQVERLNSEDVATVRRILQHLSRQHDRFPQLSLKLKLQLADDLLRAEELLEKLRGEFEATRNIADQLVSANILDELLGGRGPVQSGSAPEAARPPAPAAPVPTRLSSGNELLDSLLSELAVERGVEQLLLLRGDKPLGGNFTAEAAQLQEALAVLEKDVLDLGSSLAAGALQMLTLELPGRILAVAWPAAGHRLVVIVGVPATLSLVLHRVRQQLESLQGLLDDSAFAS